MSALLTLSACAVATWLLRVAFITLLPADRLPGVAHRALRYAGPAVLGAMVVTSLIGPDGLAALAPSARHLALLAAALVAWRVRNLAAPIIAALAVMLVAAAVS
jgi:branched-subunit amino acid transport protein